MNTYKELTDLLSCINISKRNSKFRYEMHYEPTKADSYINCKLKLLPFLLTSSYTLCNLPFEVRIILSPFFLQLKNIFHLKWYSTQTLKWDVRNRILTAASTFAGLSSLGSASIEITEIRIVSTVCTGNHLSDAFSYPYLSSPGSCKIEIQTSPLLSTKIYKKNFVREPSKIQI